jgi:hypothetical protein
MCNNVRAGTLLGLITGRLPWLPSVQVIKDLSCSVNESVAGNDSSGMVKTSDAMDVDTGEGVRTEISGDGDDKSWPSISCSVTGVEEHSRSAILLRCPGCHKLRSMQLGGVMGESETSWLVKELKAARPDLVLRA